MGGGGVQINGPKVSFELFGNPNLRISETIVVGWILIVVITILLAWLTHGMKKVPTKKRQVVAEWLVETFNNLVNESMGKGKLQYAPYIATIFIFSITGSLISILGFRSMTADFNVTLTWGIMTFLLITYNKFKYNGFFGYFKTYAEPIWIMTPMNIISEIATPLSMAFRHFGNIAGGMVITQLLYFALMNASYAIGAKIPIFAVGIPAVLSVYFDLFSGFMQAFIFIMLTLAFVGDACGDETE